MMCLQKMPLAARLSTGTLLALALGVAVRNSAAQVQPSYVIRNATVVPVTSPRLSNASVLIQNGRIAAVGSNVQAPPGATVIDASGLYVYPGLINAGTQLGLIEVGGVPGPDDTRELGDFNPQNVTMTAVNAGSEHIGVTRANGITTALTAAGGSVMSGIAALINLSGYTNEEMVAKERVALLLAWPSLGGAGGRGGGGGRFGGFGQAGSEAERRAEYERRVHQIYTWFNEARAYNDTKARLAAAGGPLPSSFRTNLKYEAMGPALKGEMPVLVDANTVDQMRDAIRFADSMKVRIIIRGARDGWRYADTLAARKIPVIVGPVTSVPSNDEPYDLVYANPGVMAKAGVLLAFQSGGASSARDLPYEVGLAIAYGLDPEEGLKSITINPARIFGVENEYGSIEVGKWANVIVTTGDPIDIRSSIKEIFIRGRRMAFDDRHTKLYELYRARPKPPVNRPPR
jgi:imidazolonepropionase-like amidohydrolase